MTTPAERARDNCQICHGANGGVRGNENRLADVIICDYCHAAITPIIAQAIQEERERCVARIELIHGRLFADTIRRAPEVKS